METTRFHGFEQDLELVGSDQKVFGKRGTGISEREDHGMDE